jgi:hypothetical protein
MRMVVASGDACRRFRPQLEALLKAQTELVEAVWSGGDVAEVEMVLRRERLTLDVFREASRLWMPLDFARNEVLLGGSEPQLGVMASTVAEQMQRAGFLKALPSGDTWMDETFLQEVRP